MENIVEVISDGVRYFFTANDDLTISRSTDCQNWEVIDFRGFIGMGANEIGTLRTPGNLTSVSLKNEKNRLIMVTNFGNYVAVGGDVIGESWIPC